ncbi:Dehydration-induced 19-like protein [Rhynchospora pubera]|uniref:Dehydration-induced 19-like protein n=1 Tax=Rhynchospora pubera TaxID=906938 RepID=A0AAV8F4H0_9POAL|nr:Dehydration-induced 19-like protein [Rhynchospora pubera]
MEADSWSRACARLSVSGTTRHSRFGDAFLGFEEMEGGDDELRADYPCPFCSDHFDLVALCCHIHHDHPLQLKTGICPLCVQRVGMDLVGHLTSHHPSFFKMQQKRRKSHGGNRKDNFQALFGGAGFANLQSSAAPDPLLSSFISNLPAISLSKDTRSKPLDEDADLEPLEKMTVQRIEPSIPVEEQEERARRSQFAQGLVLSTIFDEDGLF